MENVKNRPTVIVVFGATGDLFRKKLAQAIFDLYCGGYLPTPFRLIGFSRKPLSHEEFRARIKEIIISKGKSYSEESLNSFLSLVYYEQGDITNLETYKNLGRILQKTDIEVGVCMNKLFHLAVPPELYRPIFENLSLSGLTIPCAPGTNEEEMAWSRVLVEKPFGTDEEEARKLDLLLGSLFEEDQIFRIDHYLAKETIQNILTFRFSNALFEPLWNNQYIEKVEIKLHESLKVKDRASFYDKVGALRDVGQNHILVMLALIAMENPGKLDSKAIREARAEVLKDVVPFTKKAESYAMRAQYEGYQNEEGVRANSDTETFFKIKMKLNNRRWRGVPFFLESGKALREETSEIIVYFKAPEVCICPNGEGEHTHQNILTFRIGKNEGISALFWAKRPGFEFGLDSRALSFSYSDSDSEERKIPDAYERVLYDCIRGDQTLFASTDEVAREWKIITPISKDMKEVPLHTYKIDEYPRDTLNM